MTTLMILKVFSDCCIAFAVLASGPISFDVPLLIPAALFGIAAGLAAFFEEKGLIFLRRLCGLLAFGCLLLADGMAQTLILAVPAVYTASLIWSNRLELEYYAYRHFFLQSMWLLGGVFAAVHIWRFFGQITGDAVIPLDPNTVLRYALVHLLCGVVLQRQLRLGVGARAAGGRGQMAGALAVVAAIIAGFAVAEPLLRQSLAVVMRAIVSLIFTPLLLLVELFTWLIQWLSERSDGQSEADYEAFLDHLESIGIAGGADSGSQTAQPEQFGLDFTDLWIIFVCVVLAISAVVLILSFRKRLASADGGEVTAPVITTPKKKRVSRLSNRWRVRQIYRDFLHTEADLGMKIKCSDTSLDVHSRLHARTDKASAEALRRIYLSARYDERHEITQSQVESARTAYKNTGKNKAK